MLQLLSTVFTPELLLFLLILPLFFVLLGVEEGLDFVVVMVKLELFLVHPGVLQAEVIILLISVSLLILDFADLLRELLLILHTMVLLLSDVRASAVVTIPSLGVVILRIVRIVVRAAMVTSQRLIVIVAVTTASVFSVVNDLGGLMSTLLMDGCFGDLLDLSDIPDLSLMPTLVVTRCLGVGPVVVVVTTILVVVLLSIAELLLATMVHLSLMLPLLVVRVALEIGILISHLMLGLELILFVFAFLLALPDLVGTLLLIVMVLIVTIFGVIIVGSILVTLSSLIAIVASTAGSLFLFIFDRDNKWLSLLLGGGRGSGLRGGLLWVKWPHLLVKVGLIFLPVGVRVGLIIITVKMMVVIVAVTFNLHLYVVARVVAMVMASFDQSDRDVVALLRAVMGFLQFLFVCANPPESIIRVLSVVSVAVRSDMLPIEVLRFVEMLPLVRPVLSVVKDWLVVDISLFELVVGGGFGVLVGGLGLHLKDQVATLDGDILWVEDAGVGVEATAGLVPPFGVEFVEIVAPVQVELVRLLVVGVHLDVVVKDVPGHVLGVEAVAPGVERRCPEVHPEGLLLGHMLDGGILSRDVAHFVAIDGPADVVRSPLHGVGVPLIVWVEVVGILVGLVLVHAITVDDVHGEGVVLNGGHNLNIQLVPLTRGEVGSIPVGEEGRNGAHLVGGLHSRNELAIGEVLEGRDGSAAELGCLGHAHHSHYCACKLHLFVFLTCK